MAKKKEAKGKASPKSGKILCVECDAPISAERLKIVQTDTCVNCMEQLELSDKIQKVRMVSPKTRGTQRHKMDFEVEGTEEVESINLHLRRGK